MPEFLRSRFLVLFLVPIVVLSAVLASMPHQPAAAANCQFVLGFAELRDQINRAEGSDKVGACLEDVRYDATGSVQRTTGGLLVWQRLGNATSFTDGYRTWLNGPEGLATRLNSERLQWEAQTGSDTVFQLALISSLLEGAYDGAMTFGELRAYGNFGIGTFHALDGEMAEIDGQVYQIKSDGTVNRVPNSALTPYAAVNFFAADKWASLAQPLGWNDLTSQLDTLLPTKNLMYAVKLEGTFSYLKARSVPRQSKPYPKLLQVVATQPTFEFRDVKGTLIGYRFPSFMEGVNTAGYHFHFLTADRTAGGHVLDLTLQNGRVEIDQLTQFRMILPTTGDFFGRDIGKAEGADITKIMH